MLYLFCLKTVQNQNLREREIMDTQQQSNRLESQNINKFDIEFHNTLMDCKVFWARVVSSESESLFTHYTKHTFYEIQYALEGHIGMIIDKDTKINIDQSDFIIIPPDRYHQIVDSDSQGARFIMAFSLEFKAKHLKNAMKYFDAPKPYGETPEMRKLLELILEKSYTNAPLHKQIITTLLESFFLEITETVLQNNISNGTDGDFLNTEERFNKICAFIANCNGIGISVASVAKSFNTSERHLNRIVKAATGKSAKELINHEKLKKIEEYITTTSLSLNEIAELCGFSDAYAMNKFFKRYNFSNPSSLRKTAQK